MSKVREESLNLIKSAYENKELGFQKGATSCRYYDPKSDSCCAVGVLVKDESLFETNGVQNYPFDFGNISEDDKKEAIFEAMTILNLDSFKGLTKKELSRLQSFHDNLIHRPSDHREYIEDHKRFKDYLYSL